MPPLLLYPSLPLFPGEGNKKNNTAQEKNATAGQPPRASSDYTIYNKKDATHQEKHPTEELKLSFSFLLSFGH